MPLREQLIDNLTADKPGPSRDKNPHRNLSPRPTANWDWTARIGVKLGLAALDPSYPTQTGLLFGRCFILKRRVAELLVTGGAGGGDVGEDRVEFLLVGRGAAEGVF